MDNDQPTVEYQATCGLYRFQFRDKTEFNISPNELRRARVSGEVKDIRKRLLVVDKNVGTGQFAGAATDLKNIAAALEDLARVVHENNSKE